MKKYFDTVANANGSPINGASVAVVDFGTVTPSSLFSDSTGTTPLSNPVITNSRGYFEFYAADGRYSLSISGPAFTTLSITDILLDDPADANAVVVSGGTINNTTIGATTPSTGAFTTLSATGLTTVATASGDSQITFTNATAGTGFLGVMSSTYGASVSADTRLYAGGGGNLTLMADNAAAGIKFATGGNAERMRLDASGNLGIGVTPSVWSAGKALQISTTSALFGDGAATYIGDNFYYNTTWRYKTTAAANQYFTAPASGHVFLSAASAAANSALTWTAVLAVNLGGTLALQGATSATGCGISFPAAQVASSDANTLDDYREGSYTATATGMTTAPTGTVNFVKVGNVVTIEVPTISGTSNAGTFTLTGMPAAIRPASQRTVLGRTSDNGGAVGFAAVQIETSGVITLYRDAAGNSFTASGTKTVNIHTMSYII